MQNCRGNYFAVSPVNKKWTLTLQPPEDNLNVNDVNTYCTGKTKPL